MHFRIMRATESGLGRQRGGDDHEAAAWALGAGERDVNRESHTSIIAEVEP